MADLRRTTTHGKFSAGSQKQNRTWRAPRRSYAATVFSDVRTFAATVGKLCRFCTKGK